MTNAIEPSARNSALGIVPVDIVVWSSLDGPSATFRTALAFWREHVFREKPVSTFSRHALVPARDLLL
jgi:hypothetical protein